MDESKIRTVSVADAKAHLSEILTAVEAGEQVDITRRGKAIATLSPKARRRVPVDLAWLRSVTAGMQPSDLDSAELIRQLRDDARY